MSIAKRSLILVAVVVVTRYASSNLLSAQVIMIQSSWHPKRVKIEIPSWRPSRLCVYSTSLTVDAVRPISPAEKHQQVSCQSTPYTSQL